MHGGLGVQSAVLRIHQRSAPKLNLAHLGAAKVQAFCVADSARTCVDLRPFSEARLGAQPRLPIMSPDVGDSKASSGRHCRYTRIWEYVSTWAEQPNWQPRVWRPYSSVQDWWDMITTSTTVSRKAGRSLTLLVIWELWKERNARVFRRREASTLTLMTNIKAEAAAWMLAGAKDLALLLSRE